MDATYLAGHCPRCGTRLPPDAPEGLCAACLLAAGADSLTMAPSDDAQTVLSPLSASAGAIAAGKQLEDGQRFGPYRIGRLLGAGGMGEVYEAEHIDTGRRLALKVLRGRLNDAEDRARFLREGQLAASVSHPHTVYIYGSEEIGGMPVISMELLPGGTLKDRVSARGPMPPVEAVTAVLDIIGGLDAAQAAGILHRDIKPSNCFSDADGSVKVGDFGLSISTLARDVQHAGWSQVFQGTPQFAAPEQLRGQPLDVRADIYAVGATLFYLLTGEPVFEGKDLGELAKRVLNDPPRSPRTVQPSIPGPLAAVVLQCLAKDAAARPASYAALADLLRPFSTTATVPARLSYRLMAGVVDALVVSFPFTLAATWLIGPDTTASRSFRTRPENAWAAIASFIYFLVLESRWAASLGKRLFGLRVVSTSGTLSFRQVLIRTAVNFAPIAPSALAALIIGTDRADAVLKAHVGIALAMVFLPIVGAPLVFVTMRRNNGYAAVHDLASGTRVVTRPMATLRRGAEDAPRAEWAPRSTARARCGPFDVLGAAFAQGYGGPEEVREVDEGLLLTGFDPVLRRRVWIRAMPSGAPPVSDARRDVGRVGRLHWLAGRRSAAENWDAFEAPDGKALVDVAEAQQPWSAVKAWLQDMAAELDAGEHDGSLPALALDRVWIRNDGRAVLLDFPAPRTGAGAGGRAGSDRAGDTTRLTPVGLLAAVGRFALQPASDRQSGESSTMPLSAASLLEAWDRTGASTPIAAARTALARVAASPDRVLRSRRVIPIVVAALPLVTLLVGMVATVPVLRAATTAEKLEMYRLLGAIDAADTGRTPETPERMRAMEIYLASRFGSALTDDRMWTTLIGETDLARLRPIATRVAATHPPLSDEALADATRVLAPDLDRIHAEYATKIAPGTRGMVEVMAGALFAIGGGFDFVLCLAGAVIVPGGLLFRLLGLAVVTRDGREIGRLRSIGRVLIVWSPFLLWCASLFPRPIAALQAGALRIEAAAVVLAILLAGAVWSVVRPTRGPHDVLAGTWIVPR
ncbi:MAG TPA: protein kinase [Vicinamibacterales bacterium]|nr:protein kinase [Vicinamibacterales bacterium]